MSLIDLAVSVTLGQRRAPEHLDLALFNGAVEVTDRGYRRHEIAKGRWSIRAGQVSVPCRFGKFFGSTTFDRAVLMFGEEVIEEVPMLAPMTVPPETVYDHEFFADWKREP